MIEPTGPEDECRGIRKFELSDGTWIELDAEEITHFGLKNVLARFGYANEADQRIDLEWDGHIIGTLPGDFDIRNPSSMSMMFTPRAGDFRHENGKIIASADLGPGDIAAIKGFRKK